MCPCISATGLTAPLWRLAHILRDQHNSGRFSTLSHAGWLRQRLQSGHAELAPHILCTENAHEPAGGACCTEEPAAHGILDYLCSRCAFCRFIASAAAGIMLYTCDMSHCLWKPDSVTKRRGGGHADTSRKPDRDVDRGCAAKGSLHIERAATGACESTHNIVSRACRFNSHCCCS